MTITLCPFRLSTSSTVRDGPDATMNQLVLVSKNRLVFVSRKHEKRPGAVAEAFAPGLSALSLAGDLLQELNCVVIAGNSTRTLRRQEVGESRHGHVVPNHR